MQVQTRKCNGTGSQRWLNAFAVLELSRVARGIGDSLGVLRDANRKRSAAGANGFIFVIHFRRRLVLSFFVLVQSQMITSRNDELTIRRR